MAFRKQDLGTRVLDVLIATGISFFLGSQKTELENKYTHTHAHKYTEIFLTLFLQLYSTLLCGPPQFIQLLFHELVFMLFLMFFQLQTMHQ